MCACLELAWLGQELLALCGFVLSNRASWDWEQTLPLHVMVISLKLGTDTQFS